MSELTQEYLKEVEDCVKEINSKFQGKIVSDIIDPDGYQYVNLVQKGGGVLGVALVGYTYILEKAGIRFLRLAGTSAGAINTGLMAVIDYKKDPAGNTVTKSQSVLDIMTELDFFKIVDGHPFARWVIKNFIADDHFGAKVKKWVLGFLGLFILLLVLGLLFLGLEKHWPGMHVPAVLSFVVMGFYIVGFLSLVAYLAGLVKRFKNSGFGINPGDYFYDWIKKNLSANGVDNVTQLRDKAAQKAVVGRLRIREGRSEPIDDLVGDVTFITSELVTENKIQFPEMCDLFRPKNPVDKELQPAGFIRASMAIPLFFESYFISEIPKNDPEVKDAWFKRFRCETPPETARFVDGGVLSNFPFSIFYKREIDIPRMPTFGIDLDDTDPKDKEEEPENWSFGGYFHRLFNTIRYYYDKDFLLKNEVFRKGIGVVKLSGFNWLDFFMTHERKKKMFVLGARAATDFLLKFEWEDYKDSRSQLSGKKSVS